MNWKYILKTEINKGEFDITWENCDLGGIDWENLPEGYEEDTSSKAVLLDVVGSVDIDIRPTRVKEAHTSVHSATLYFEYFRFLHEDNENYKSIKDEEIEITDGFEWGDWSKGEFNPDMLNFYVDMNKSFDPKKWHVEVSISWRNTQ